jgi:putative protease
MVKIAAPFTSEEEVLPLIEAGADELYCGYLSPEWERQFTGLEFERKGAGSNFRDIDRLKRSIARAHKKGIPVYLTLNGLYVNSQYPLLLDIVDELDALGPDGYIVADIGLLLTLKQRRCARRIHVSTGGTVFNSEAVRFYKSLGVSRIVLDRHTSLSAIKELAGNHPEIDFEVFIMNTLCVYIDGFCTFMHTYGRESEEDVSKKEWGNEEKLSVVISYDPEAEADACRLRYAVDGYDATRGRKITGGIEPTFFKHLVDGKECGACALYDIARTDVASVKIVGRQGNPDDRLRTTRFIRACIDILRSDRGIARSEYTQKVQSLYRKSFEYKTACKGNNCYHPSVLTAKD